MVRLPALIDLLASFGGHERATWEVFARNLRDGGYLSPSRRGRGASHATMEDAAALLLAGVATTVPTHGVRAIERIGTLSPGEVRTESPEKIADLQWVASTSPVEILSSAMRLIAQETPWRLNLTFDRRRYDLHIELYSEEKLLLPSAKEARISKWIFSKKWSVAADLEADKKTYSGWHESVALSWWLMQAVATAVLEDDVSDPSAMKENANAR